MSGTCIWNTMTAAQLCWGLGGHERLAFGCYNGRLSYLTGIILRTNARYGWRS